MPDTPNIERRRRVLSAMVDLDTSVGLEIGPLDRPIVRREDGFAIKYLDRLGTEALRQKFASGEVRNVDEIVPVDFVVDEGKISAVVSEKFDYVVASHVFEHVPDPISWLNDIDAILRPGGSLFLAVPDKRFTFDIDRPLTTLGDFIEAYRTEKTRPSMKNVFDQLYYHVRVDPGMVWKNNCQRPDDLSRTFPSEEALFKADRTTHFYVDCHCSVFTSSNFHQVIHELRQLELQPFRVGGFVDVDPPFNDFLCALIRA